MNNRISKKRILLVAFLGLIAAILFLSYRPLLLTAGHFLAPEKTGPAEVVIIQGNGQIEPKAVRIATDLVSSGIAGRLVAVIHEGTRSTQTFAPPGYPSLLTKHFEALGLRERQFQIVVAPSNHPTTLTEANIVLSDLSKYGVKSAILLAEGFHTRRSFWAYKQMGLPLGIEIIPYPYFTSYRKETWWQHTEGIHVFVYESLKFIYYLLRGYIPLKSLFVT